MTSERGSAHLVSNFREALSILENLRASPLPGRGMRHLPRRPIVEGLRASEAAVATGGVDGEFPILCRVGPPVVIKDGAYQAASVPISCIGAFVFRTEAERDQLAGKMFENASVDGLRMEVAPQLFELEGEARFGATQTHGPLTAEAAGWTTADALAGASAAALALARRRPEIAAAARAFFDDDSAVPAPFAALVDAVLAPDGPWTGPGVAVAAVAFALRSTTGQDPIELVDVFGDALERTSYDRDTLDRFRQFATDVLTDRRARRPQDFTDEGDVLLRALLLFLQRDRVDDIVDDAVDGIPPGSGVHLTAAVLAGLREGLARMPSALKQPFRDVLGELASELEARPFEPPAAFIGAVRALVAPVSAAKPPAEAAAAGCGTDEGDTDGSKEIFRIVRRLEATAAASLGLTGACAEEGLVGRCPSSALKVTVSNVPKEGAGKTQIALRVAFGTVGDQALLREALAGALQARPGSLLWLPPGSDSVELVYPVPDGTDDLEGVLTHNVGLVRRWRAAVVPAVGGRGEAETPADASGGTKSPKKRRTVTGKRRSSKAASGAAPPADGGQNVEAPSEVYTAQPHARRRPRRTTAGQGREHPAAGDADLLEPLVQQGTQETGEAAGGTSSAASRKDGVD